LNALNLSGIYKLIAEILFCNYPEYSVSMERKKASHAKTLAYCDEFAQASPHDRPLGAW
jgi:hypothetical protein